MKATDKTNTSETNESGISEFTTSFYKKCEKILSKYQVILVSPMELECITVIKSGSNSRCS